MAGNHPRNVRDDLRIEFEWEVRDPSRGTYKKLWEDGNNGKLMCRFGSDKISEIRGIFAIIGSHKWNDRRNKVENVRLDYGVPEGVVAYRLYEGENANPRQSTGVLVREVPSATYLLAKQKKLKRR